MNNFSEKLPSVKNTEASSESFLIKAFAFWFMLILALIFLDQIVKFLAQSTSAFVWLNYFRPVAAFRLFYNDQFAFSLPLPKVYMYGSYFAVLILVFSHIAARSKSFSRPVWVSWGLIIAGALSNIGERIYRGAVVDFVYFLNGIFNLADAYIILGILVLIFWPRRES